MKDYKITTSIDKKKYIKMRTRLLEEGMTFSDWLDRMLDLGILEIKDEKFTIDIKPLTEKELMPKPTEKIPPPEPIVKTFFKKAGEIHGEDYV